MKHDNIICILISHGVLNNSRKFCLYLTRIFCSEKFLDFLFHRIPFLCISDMFCIPIDNGIECS